MSDQGESGVSRETRGEIQFEKDIFPLEIERIAERQERVLGFLKPGLRVLPREPDGAAPEPPPEAEEAPEERKVLRFPFFSKGNAPRRAPWRRIRFTRQPKPSTDLGLVGLALSGGGIRSATFNLGVVQALNERGMLRQVDYVSTVSGGGYLGSCLSSVLNHAHPRHDQLPFGEDAKGRERKAVQFLRNNSNYLAPGGLLDLVRIPALLLRGIILHFLVVLPYIFAAVWLTDLVYGRALREAWRAERIEVFFRLAPIAVVAFLVYVLLSPMLQKRIRGGFKLRNWYERSFGFLLLAVGAVGLLEGLITLLSAYDYHLTRSLFVPHDDTAQFVKSLHESVWWTVLSSIGAFLFAGNASANVSKLRGKLILCALAVLGPLVLLLVYFFLAEWGIFGYAPPVLKRFGWLETAEWPILSFLPHRLGESGWLNASFLAVLLWLWGLRYVDVNKTSLHSFYRDRLSQAYLFRVDDDDEIQANDAEKLSSLNGLESISPYHIVNASLNLQASKDPNLRGRNADFFFLSRHFVGSDRTGFCATENIEDLDPHLNLGTAMAISAAAAAPNMGSTTIKPLVFIMTLLNVRLGYWLPNPRYAHEEARRGPGSLLLKMGVGPLYLLAELFSLLNEDSRYVNVSDGGHIENLGIYELLRRRCKFIIASDAEADLGLSFHGLATLIRYARIDHGIEIDVELDDVRRGPDGLSRKQCALGRIHYPKTETQEAQIGYLLYIKSSIIGGENEYIREYRTRNVDFPHESTGDQFFNEAQFEAYRALGYFIGRSLFPETRPASFETEEVRTVDTMDVVDRWWEDLTVSLRPQFNLSERFESLQHQLSAIEKAFTDPALAAYSYQIYPEIQAARAEAAAAPRLRDPEGDAEEAFRRVFHVCRLQMQLMESAYLQLELDRPRNRDHYLNRGWMNLFRRWAHAPFFRHAWAVSQGTFSLGFQRFCEESLRLGSEMTWHRESWANLSARERSYLRDLKLDRFVAGEGTEGYEIWMADLAVPIERDREEEEELPADAFSVGLVVLRFTEGTADLLFYRVRNFYRRMRVFERMIETLPAELRRRRGEELRPRVRFGAGDEALKWRYRDLFERNGFEVAGNEARAPEAGVGIG